MRGRRPTPAALKLLRGNPGRRPIPAAPEVTGDPPEAPGWLSDVEKEKWSEIVGELHPRGVIQSTDRDILTAYACTWCRWRAASETLAREGLVIFTRRGEQKRSPWAILEKQLSDTLAKIGEQLGMTPLSRVRLGVPVRTPEDELTRFLKR